VGLRLDILEHVKLSLKLS